MWTMIGSTYQLSPQRDFTEKLPNELIAVPHLKSLSEQKRLCVGLVPPALISEQKELFLASFS